MNRILSSLFSKSSVAVLALALIAAGPTSVSADGLGSGFFEVGSKVDSKVNSEGSWLGVQVQTVNEALVSSLDLRTNTGVYVTSVVDASPAEDAGVHPGDVIVEYNYNRVATAGALVSFVAENSAGDEVVIFVDRGGKKKRLVAHLSARPLEQKARIRSFHRPTDNDASDNAANYRRQERDNRPRDFRFRVHTAPYIGISLQTIHGQLAEYFAIPEGAGALITMTLPDSPAEDAGLKAGDVVIAADGEPILVLEDLQRVVRGRQSGDKIEVTVIRNKRKTKFTVTVAEREAERSELRDRLGSRVFGLAPSSGDNHFPFGMKNGFGVDRGGGYFDADRGERSDRRGRGLDPISLPAVIYSGNQEKSQRIESLEKRIQELKKQIENMRSEDNLEENDK